MKIPDVREVDLAQKAMDKKKIMQTNYLFSFFCHNVIILIMVENVDHTLFDTLEDMYTIAEISADFRKNLDRKLDRSLTYWKNYKNVVRN